MPELKIVSKGNIITTKKQNISKSKKFLGEYFQ